MIGDVDLRGRFGKQVEESSRTVAPTRSGGNDTRDGRVPVHVLADRLDLPGDVAPRAQFFGLRSPYPERRTMYGRPLIQ